MGRTDHAQLAAPDQNHLGDRELCALSGIYDVWRAPAGKCMLDSLRPTPQR